MLMTKINLQGQSIAKILGIKKIAITVSIYSDVFVVLLLHRLYVY